MDLKIRLIKNDIIATLKKYLKYIFFKFSIYLYKNNKQF